MRFRQPESKHTVIIQLNTTAMATDKPNVATAGVWLNDNKPKDRAVVVAANVMPPTLTAGCSGALTA